MLLTLVLSSTYPFVHNAFLDLLLVVIIIVVILSPFFFTNYYIFVTPCFVTDG